MTTKNVVDQALELMKKYNEISLQYEEIHKMVIDEERRITPNLEKLIDQMSNDELLRFYNSIDVTTVLKFELFKHMKKLGIL